MAGCVRSDERLEISDRKTGHLITTERLSASDEMHQTLKRPVLLCHKEQ